MRNRFETDLKGLTPMESAAYVRSGISVRIASIPTANLEIFVPTDLVHVAGSIESG